MPLAGREGTDGVSGDDTVVAAAPGFEQPHPARAGPSRSRSRKSATVAQPGAASDRAHEVADAAAVEGVAHHRRLLLAPGAAEMSHHPRPDDDQRAAAPWLVRMRVTKPTRPQQRRRPLRSGSSSLWPATGHRSGPRAWRGAPGRRRAVTRARRLNSASPTLITASHPTAARTSDRSPPPGPARPAHGRRAGRPEDSGLTAGPTPAMASSHPGLRCRPRSGSPRPSTTG